MGIKSAGRSGLRIDAPMTELMTADDVLGALAEIRAGRIQLTAEEQLSFIDAIEQVARALISAPRGNRDGLAMAIWHAHERTPALARLADAAKPGRSALVAEIEAERLAEERVLRQLRALYE